MNILVIAPHGDDEVLGCGGTIAKHGRRNDNVYRCIVTKPYIPDWPEEFCRKREQEITDSARILNVRKDFLLGFPTVKLDTIAQKEINDALLKVIKEVEPEIVYISGNWDLNLDHRLIFEASLVATRALPNTSIRKVLGYEVVSETEWARSLRLFVPDYYSVLSDEDIDIKLKAMQLYASEVHDFPHPRSLEVIRSLAKLRGSEVGHSGAEAFRIIREINI